MQSPVRRLICAALVLLGVGRVWAGGSGLNVIVVVNQRSTNSIQLANDYCLARGVPPQNVFRMTNWSGGSVEWNRSDFETCLRQPLLGMLSERSLTNQALFVLLSMDIPYRVEDVSNSQNSTTSALFYGFKPDGVSPDPSYPSCSLPIRALSSYAFSELPPNSGAPATADTNSFLAMMLTDNSLAGAEFILDSGVASDSSFPTQTVYLTKSGGNDLFRNVRFLEFDNAIFDSRIRGDSTILRLDTDSTSFTNILGLLTGHSSLSLPTGAFAPGSIGDNLTSFGGMLFEQTGQTTLLAFLEAGAAASFGTVVEPCNYLEKFPNPLDYFYQDRGFCAAEAYYQSVRAPFQGLMVGEPLAAPFARRGSALWNGLTNGTLLSGQTLLTPSVDAPAINLPLSQVDLFVDGTFCQTLTNLPPTPGNVLSVTLNGVQVSYTVPTNAILPSVAAGLASAINAQSDSARVTAYPTGDRLELQSLSKANPGSDVTLSVGSSQGTGALLTTWLSPARSNFLDSVAAGYVGILLTNSPGSGDWVQLDVLKTNGVHVILAVTNPPGNTDISSLSQTLIDQINATPALQSADGVSAGDLFPSPSEAQFFLYARSAGWLAAEAQIVLAASPNLGAFPSVPARLEDNLTDLRPRNHLYVSSGVNSLAANCWFDTTRLADGYHELAVIAYEGDSVRTQTRVSRSVQIQNTSLSASLTTPLVGTNVTLDFPLQFTVTASTSNISTIQLFSTGGLVATVSNQQSAIFLAPSTMLWLGVHPFYALVTDNAGLQYRTQTLNIRFVPSIELSLSGRPLTLVWPSVSGLSYEILASTNLAAGFQTVTTVTASGATAQWPVSASGATAAFYRVRLQP